MDSFPGKDPRSVIVRFKTAAEAANWSREKFTPMVDGQYPIAKLIKPDLNSDQDSSHDSP